MDIGRDEAQKRLASLNRRERQVFDLTMEGLNLSAIAVRLGVQRSTVSGYKSDMYEKLGIGYASEIMRERELFDIYQPLAEAPLKEEPKTTGTAIPKPEAERSPATVKPVAKQRSRRRTPTRQHRTRTETRARRGSRNLVSWFFFLGIIGLAAWGIWAVIQNGTMQPNQSDQENPVSVILNTPVPTRTTKPTARPTLTPRPNPTATRTSQSIPSGYVAMPNLLGLHYRDAERVIEDNGLVFSISYYYNVSDLDLEPGTIKEQDPEPGTPVNENTLIKLYRSTIPIIIHPSDNDCAVQLMVYSERGDLEWAAYLTPQRQYKIRTNFSYAEQLYVLNENGSVIASGSIFGPSYDEVNFTVSTAGYYTIRIPYVFDYAQTGGNVTNEQQLSQGVRSGCLGLYEN